MEGYTLKILELTDGGEFECRSEDGEHYHDITLRINCELNNKQCGIVVVGHASAIATPIVPSQTATTATPISTHVDGVGHNSSNHSIDATHNELNNNNNNMNLRYRTTSTTTTISAHAVPTAADTLSVRNSSANQNNNNRNSDVVDNDINSDVSVFPTPNVDSVVVVNRMVARQIVDDKSKRFRSNYARG